jgi:hypothetical protein
LYQNFIFKEKIWHFDLERFSTVRPKAVFGNIAVHLNNTYKILKFILFSGFAEKRFIPEVDWEAPMCKLGSDQI